MKNYHRQLMGMFTGGAGVSSTGSMSSQMETMASDTKMLLEEQIKSNKHIQMLLEKNQKILKKASGNDLGLEDLVLAKYLTKFLSKAGLAIGTGLAGVGAIAKNGVGFVTSGITKIMKQGRGVILGFFHKTIGSGLSAVRTFSTGMVRGVKSSLAPIMRNSMQMITKMGSALSKVPKLLGKLFWPVTALIGLYDGFKGWGRAEEVLGKSNVNFVDKLSSAIGSAINGLFLGIPDWISRKMGARNLASALSNAGNTVSNILKGVGTQVRDLTSFIGGRVSDSVNWMWSSIPSVKSISEQLPKIGTSIKEGLSNIAGKIKDTVSGMFTNAIDNLKGWVKDGWDWITSDDKPAHSQPSASVGRRGPASRQTQVKAELATIRRSGRRRPSTAQQPSSKNYTMPKTYVSAMVAGSSPNAKMSDYASYGTTKTQVSPTVNSLDDMSASSHPIHDMMYQSKKEKQIATALPIETRKHLDLVSINTGTKIVEVIGAGQIEFLEKLTKKYGLDKLESKPSDSRPMMLSGGGGGYTGEGYSGTGYSGGSGYSGGGGHGPGYGRSKGSGGSVSSGGSAGGTSGTTAAPSKPHPFQKITQGKGPMLGPTVKAAAKANALTTNPASGNLRSPIQLGDQTERVKRADLGDASRQQWNNDTYNFLKSEKGFTHEQAKVAAAGFTGNASVESGNFNKMREVGQRKNKGGYGVVQWTASRRKEFAKFAAERGMDINNPDHVADYDLNFDFFKHELNGPEKGVLSKLQKDGLTPEHAGLTVSKFYERPGTPHINRRMNDSRTAYSLPLNDPKNPKGSSTPVTPPVTEPTSSIPEWAQTPANAKLSQGSGSNILPMPEYKRKQGGWKGVDPRMEAIYKKAGESFPLRTQFVSGRAGRGKGSHSRGKAFDMIMYDQAGNPLPNYGKNSSEYFRPYELFGQHAMKVGKEMHPELFDGKGEDFQSGLFFGDGGGKEGFITSEDGRRKGLKYGSLDGMDYRIDTYNKFRAGNLKTGLNDEYKGIWDKGDLLGGSKPFTEENYRKGMEQLQDFRLTPEQAKKARGQLAHTARTYGSNKGENKNIGPKGSMMGYASILAGDPLNAKNNKSGLTNNIYNKQGSVFNRSSGATTKGSMSGPTLANARRSTINRPGFASSMQTTSMGTPANSSTQLNEVSPSAASPSSATPAPVNVPPPPALTSQATPQPAAQPQQPPPQQQAAANPDRSAEMADIPSHDETSMMIINGSALT